MPNLFSKFCVSLSVVLMGTIAPHLTQETYAQIPPKGTFTASKPCPATKNISGDNPGNVQLAVDQTYTSAGFNSASRTHILLKISGVTPNQRWVKTECGSFQPSDSGSTVSDNTQLLPFFDNQNNPISVNFPSGIQKDITPPPPQVEPFDQRVLAMCGTGFDAPVSEQSFRQLLRDYPDVFKKLKSAAGGELKSTRSSDTAFIDDLVQIWFSKQGFKHIFCGETGRLVNNIPILDGLHLVSRYFQLQQQPSPKAGRFVSNKTKQEVVDGVIYTFGTRVVQGNVIIAESPIKGYSYVLNAQEILIHATKAFKVFNPTAGQPSACLYTVSDPDAAPFQSVFVKKEDAIITFYPDATPEGNTCES
jgi:hypothetical protein